MTAPPTIHGRRNEMDMTIEAFCAKHTRACPEGREWAIANCADMREVWDTARSDWLIWVATRPGVLTDRELRLFACWCVRQIWHLLADVRSRHAVEVAERYAVGEATDDELGVARDAARDVAWATAGDVAWATAWAAAGATVGDTVGDVAWATARATARDVARDVEWATARAIAWDAQATYLRENCSPDFTDTDGSREEG